MDEPSDSSPVFPKRLEVGGGVPVLLYTDDTDEA